MRGGRLRHRLTFLSGAKVSDGRGGTTATWQTVATVHGEIKMIEADEREVAERLVAGATHRYLVRWSAVLAALTPKDLRIAWQRRIFQVGHHLDGEGRQREIRGIAKEILA